eukprot:TRINITY_DN1575_c0_g1_i9.p1 TRINITY_DN1575_c0_g1~~TRINITY_DN1575_c0_g1_i9.p1  ORF type:complete len:111 (+),score=13.92 TRINITY_DN1575_c0_g1_i9:158-490(+)
MCIRDRVSTQSTWGTKIIYEQGIKIQRGGGGYMEFSQYIADNALILIPALYIIGMLIKNIEKIADKYIPIIPVSYTHLRAHETGRNLVCRLLLEKKKNNNVNHNYTLSHL